MKWFRTGFSRVHAAVAADVLATLTLGALMALGVLPYRPFGTVHGILGLSIFPLLLLLPLFSRKRKSLYKAMKSKLFITRRDIRNPKPLLIAAKVVTQLMALTLLFQLLTGLLIATGLAYRLFPAFGMISFHMSFLWVLGSLVLVHLTLMLLSKGARSGH